MKPQVLVVEDDRSMCELLELGLGRRGFSVHWTTEPTQVLDLLRQRAFAVVVTDIKMPKLSGIDLTRQLLNGWPELPVVVITAFGSIDSADAAMRAGAYDFVTKPLEIDALARVLERAVQRCAKR